MERHNIHEYDIGKWWRLTEKTSMEYLRVSPSQL